jgi:hypothetical protein
MKPGGEIGTLRPGENMTNQKDAHSKEYQEALSTGAFGARFEIHVKGQLDQSWSDWLEGLDVALLENGEMILSGRIADQAALMGVLNKLNGLNLALLSLSKVE